VETVWARKAQCRVLCEAQRSPPPPTTHSHPSVQHHPEEGTVHPAQPDTHHAPTLLYCKVHTRLHPYSLSDSSTALTSVSGTYNVRDTRIVVEFTIVTVPRPQALLVMGTGSCSPDRNAIPDEAHRTWPRITPARPNTERWREGGGTWVQHARFVDSNTDLMPPNPPPPPTIHTHARCRHRSDVEAAGEQCSPVSSPTLPPPPHGPATYPQGTG
jgi:hypothetical protein